MKPVFFEKEVANGIFLTFTQKDGKLEMSSENRKLQNWIDSRKKRNIKPDEIYFAVKAAKEYLKTGIAQGKGRNNPNATVYDNPIIELAEKCQSIWGKPIITEVTGKTGQDHCPIISVKIMLPNGRIFVSSAGNQKAAKAKAATNALFILNNKIIN
ncbi:MAG: hypothetical protein LBS01_04455 [Prevotellaceae bacterium]|jgi:hypothetical protein|nr:hypothetical protein [Prevotellaceae bacterium]